MDAFNRACESSEQYPKQLMHHDWLHHNLKAWSDRLDSEECRLFDESKAAVKILDLGAGEQSAFPRTRAPQNADMLFRHRCSLKLCHHS
jgi:hypothetical protein